MRRNHPLSVVLILALASHEVALAEPEDADPRQTAARLIDDGNGLLKAGILASALAKYEQAYALVPSPKIRLNIAEVYMQMGSRDLAAREYDAFLREVDARTPLLNSVRARLADLERELASLTIDCASSGVELEVDGRAIGTAPISRMFVEAGRHGVRARLKDKEVFSTEVEVPRGETVRVVVVLAPDLALSRQGGLNPGGSIHTNSSEAALSDKGSILSAWWFWAGLGAVAIAGASTAIVLTRRQDTRPMPELGSTSFDEWSPR